MSNHFASGAIMSPIGWIAFYRDVRWSQNRVLREGKYDIIFASEQEAREAGHKALMDHLNGNSEFMTAAIPSVKAVKRAKFDKLFRNGKVIEIERKGDVA